MLALKITCLINVCGRKKGSKDGGVGGGQRKLTTEGRKQMHRQDYSYPTSFSHYMNTERQMPFAVCFRDNPPLASFLRAAVLETLK